MMPGEAPKTEIDGSDVFDHIRSQWLSNIIHDLSGALFAARGYLRMVLEESNGALSDPQRRYIVSSLENVNRLVNLTHELNEFPGKGWFNFDIIAFRSLLQQTVADVSATSLGTNVQVIEKVGSGPLSTMGDAAKLAEAMKAFLAAAFEFAGPGGTVHLSAHEENEKIIVEFRAASLPGKPADKPVCDLSLACKILRLNGGTVFVSTTGKAPAEAFLVTCELPVIPS